MKHNRRITKGDRNEGIYSQPVIGNSKRFALTFGKYKGITSDKIPRPYLSWVVKTCSQIPKDQIKVIKDYLST